MPHPTPQVIVLSGTSAAGKTTLARALQQSVQPPHLYAALDAFIDMLPRLEDDLFAAMETGYHHAVAALARAGNNVITDHFRPDLDLDLYAGLAVHVVGVHCSLEELRRREARRPVAMRGFAEAQFEHFHSHRSYDLEVDTSEQSVADCVSAVSTSLAVPGRAFDRMSADRERGRPVG